MSMVWEQKWLMILVFPFIFLGGVGDFLFPNLIANVINSMKEQDPKGVSYNLIYWVIVILVGAVSSMINGILSGIISERLGNSLRTRLFASLIRKDVAFYDESRVGDLCKATLLI